MKRKTQTCRSVAARWLDAGHVEGDALLLLPRRDDPATAPHGQILLLHRRRGAADRRLVGNAEAARVQAGRGAMRRPKLNRVPPVPRCDAGQCIVTMSVGHWDEILQQAYRQGGPAGTRRQRDADCGAQAAGRHGRAWGRPVKLTPDSQRASRGGPDWLTRLVTKGTFMRCTLHGYSSVSTGKKSSSSKEA